VSPHESPSWPDCVKMRQDCQQGIFDKMDRQHGETLRALGVLADAVATVKGEQIGEDRAQARLRDSGQRDSVDSRWNWKTVTAAVTGVAVAVAAAILAVWELLQRSAT
jgi:hypothetical protein